MNLAQDVAEHVTAIAREARILRPHVVSKEMKSSLEMLFDQINDLGIRFDFLFAKIPHRYFTRSKARTMDMEARMTTMEDNHQVLQDKFDKLEKDLKEEIAQAQRNTVGQIALILGMPDPRRGKGVEESIPIGDSPYIPDKTSHHAKEHYGTGTSQTKVQFNTGTAANIPLNSEVVYNHDPDVEVPDFDEIDGKSKMDRKLEECCEKLEEMIRSMQGASVHGGIDARELSLVSNLVIPPKFKTPEFEKFDGTTCPSAHLTMYYRKMALYLDNEKLLIHCFQDSLVESAARCYTQLSKTNIRTWRDLSRAFLEQYKHVTDMVPGRTALQSMEQKANESFRQYAQRWREVAAQVQPPLLENEVTLLFVNTLKDDFYDRMLDHATKPFADMVMTGELIQAAIKSGRIKGGSESWKHFKKRDNEVNTTSSYTPGYSTGIIIGQPNHSTTTVASSQSSSKQEVHNKKERREKPTFTPIPMRYEELFPKLVESRLIAPRYIMPVQPPYPPWYNPNVKCDYHAGLVGHHIDNCTAFKHAVEHLLKMGMLSFETQEKNPLPNHKNVNAVIEGNDPKVKEHLSYVITPLKWVWEKLVENRILKRQEVVTRIRNEAICEFHGKAGHVIQECEKFKQLVQEMMNSKELEFFERVPDQEIEDICASDDSPVQGGFAGCKPLVIKVSPRSVENVPKTTPRVIIKAHVPFPYRDSRQVPWKYNCEVSEPVKTEETEENVNEVGNFTCSGRCYSTQPNVETVKNQKGKAPAESSDKNFDDEPIPEYHAPVKESEAKEFLKILKHSEFNVVEQLNRLPARISMLSLLLSSELHRNALLKILNQTFVPKEIPAGGRGSHKALHITTRCKGYMLPGVLVDNGSALNVLPLATLKKLPIDSTHMKPYQNTVRAFDGTQREVIGKIEIPLMIGPSEYEVDFVVMDIKPTYSCLLGRPWIHAAGAVPSTLHQKLKFVIDGKLVTIKAEEDIIASISSDTPYIEVDEDAVECTFRSLELVNATFVEENKRMTQFGLSRCAKMQVKQTYGKGAQIGKGYRGDYIQVPDINGVSNIIPDSQVDFDQNLSPEEFIDCEDEAGCDLPNDLLRMMESEEKQILPHKEELEILNLGTEEERREVKIGTTISVETRQNLIKLLHEYKDVFPWSYQDMPGLNENIAMHKLPIKQECRLVQQKLRRMKPEMLLKIRDEVKKQFDAGFLQAVTYSDWVANIVPVPKRDGKVRMCVDYRDLNRASPKDNFPLPHIDTLVDNTTGHSYFSFMDGFSGYNQIKMCPNDMSKTTFVTLWGTFCYKVMPFGLKNAGATYQRAMVALFHDMLHKEIEVYVDDMIAKSRTEEEHLKNLKKLFQRLREFHLKLNPTKCTFGVTSGKLLGFIMSKRGIEIDPDKVRAIQELPPPRTQKEVRGFLGRLNYISRFISQLTKKCDPVYRLLRKNDSEEWNDECQDALQKIKRQLTNAPVLVPPVPNRPLILYLSIFDNSMGCVLGQHDESGKKERAIYYLSKKFTEYEAKYSPVEKLCCALAWATRRLRQYMLYHTTWLISKLDPLKYMMEAPALSGRLARWQMLLSEFDILYVSRKAVKGSAIADFIASRASDDYEPLNYDFPDEDLMNVSNLEEGDVKDSWVLYFDGASNSIGRGVGAVLISPDNDHYPFAGHLEFFCTNNMAEYEACAMGLRAAIERKIKVLKVYGDSSVVVHQIKGEWETRDLKLIEYRKLILELAKEFKDITFAYLPRENNQIADALATLAALFEAGSRAEMMPIQIQIFESPAHCCEIEEEADGNPWYYDILRYIKSREYPAQATENDKRIIRRMAVGYVLDGEVLYKRGSDQVLMRCVNAKETQQIIEEVHEGICGTHPNGFTMARCIMRFGYYWSTIESDCISYARKCHKCQIYVDKLHTPPQPLHVMTSPWPFSTWGMDVIGPIFPKASNGHRFIFVIIDYFTKWVEAASFANVTESVIFRTSTGATPYSLVYGTEAVLPIEVEIPSLRVLSEVELDEPEWIRTRYDQLNLIEEKRLKAISHAQMYQKRMIRAHQKKVRPREFREGDLVLKMILPIEKDSRGKWMPNWKEPYVVTKAFSGGALILAEIDGEELQNPVNSDSVKKYHV
ncbi:hypothetical protein V6N11_031323 [Hibiscus sabdariffa]|uniref:RNA-directed DNA polymerase n=1 Tax=Hibiscus sabdariffa TaxID=183260 RepID=A0ABR2SXA3_9ROSI